MHRPPWKLLLSVTLLGLFASGASAALIDGFGDSGVPTGGGGNMVVPADGQTNPPAVGSYIDYKNNIASDIIFGPGQPPGEREVECKIISNSRSQFAFAGVFNTFGNSFADLQSPSLGEAEMILRYGSLITTATGTNLDADMSNEAFLDFYVIGNDHPQDAAVDITLQVDQEGSGDTYFATAQLNMSVGLVQLNFGAFQHTVNGFPLNAMAMGDVDGIEYRFHAPTPGLDITIDQLSSSIPEPATMTLLGLGALALVRRRRRKKS